VSKLLQVNCQIIFQTCNNIQVNPNPPDGHQSCYFFENLLALPPYLVFELLSALSRDCSSIINFSNVFYHYLLKSRLACTIISNAFYHYQRKSISNVFLSLSAEISANISHVFIFFYGNPRVPTNISYCANFTYDYLEV